MLQNCGGRRPALAPFISRQRAAQLPAHAERSARRLPPRRHPELGRKRAGLLIQERRRLHRFPPEAVRRPDNSSPAPGGSCWEQAPARCGNRRCGRPARPLHGHHVLQVQHSLAEMPEQRVARRQRAHFVTQICELAGGPRRNLQADGDAGLARINAQAELLQVALLRRGTRSIPMQDSASSASGPRPSACRAKLSFNARLGRVLRFCQRWHPRISARNAAASQLVRKRWYAALKRRACQHAANHRQQHHPRA